MDGRSESVFDIFREDLTANSEGDGLVENDLVEVRREDGWGGRVGGGEGGWEVGRGRVGSGEGGWVGREDGRWGGRMGGGEVGREDGRWGEGGWEVGREDGRWGGGEGGWEVGREGGKWGGGEGGWEVGREGGRWREVCAPYPQSPVMLWGRSSSSSLWSAGH